MRLNSHLHFSGQCEEAFKFYEKCLGGKLTFAMTYGDSPLAETTPAEFHKKLLHATFTAGDQPVGVRSANFSVGSSSLSTQLASAPRFETVSCTPLAPF